MDNGLDEFEKQLAAEKQQRENARDREERKHRKHRHRERSPDRHQDRGARDAPERAERERDKEDGHRHHHRPRHHNDDADGHRHKRPKRSRDGGEHHNRHSRRSDEPDDRDNKLDLSSTDPKEKLPLPDEEETRAKPKSGSLARDSWMTTPSGIGIDYIQRPKKEREPSPQKEEAKRVIHKRELNALYLENLDQGKPDGGDGDGNSDSGDEAKSRTLGYRFGDEGSQWRMTKLKAVYTVAEESGRPIDEIALERYDSLQDFDDAREEKNELERRNVYGKGFIGNEQPTGELYRERKAAMLVEASHGEEPDLRQGVIIPDPEPPAPAISQTELNRMKAELLKAKLRRAPNAAQLQSDYDRALASFMQNGPPTAVISVMDNRLMAGTRAEAKGVETKRGRERGQVEENDEMTIDDMVREERRTRGQAGGEGMRLAERIAKDSRFDDDLEYLDENAAKLAKRVHKSEANLRNLAINDYQRVQRALDSCPLCHHEDKGQPPIAPILSLGTRVYLTLPTEPEITGEGGGAVIVPIAHRRNLLECDDDEWEEVRNFMKALTRMFHDQGREVLFYENAAAPGRHPHAALVAVAIPYEEGATAPAYFREAFLSSDEEWAQHRKVIDTGKAAREGAGRMAFRRSIAKEMPYFHVWFSLDGGLGHIVENMDRWPKGDLFAREVIGGIVGAGPEVIKRQGRWKREDQRVDGFRKRWRKFDWTRVLAEG